MSLLRSSHKGSSSLFGWVALYIYTIKQGKKVMIENINQGSIYSSSYISLYFHKIPKVAQCCNNNVTKRILDKESNDPSLSTHIMMMLFKDIKTKNV